MESQIRSMEKYWRLKGVGVWLLLDEESQEIKVIVEPLAEKVLKPRNRWSELQKTTYYFQS